MRRNGDAGAFELSRAWLNSFGCGVVDQLFFFHNPKAGGTSVVSALAGLFPIERRCPRIEDDATEHIQRAGRYETFKDYDFYAGHYGLDIYSAVGGGMPAATNFRWPVDRVVSVHRYFRHAVEISEAQARDPRFRAVSLAKRLSLDDFVTCDDPAVVLHTYDHHFRQLTGSGWSPVYERDLTAARTLIDEMVWFYVCEHPYESMAWADAVFAGRLASVPRLNVTGEEAAQASLGSRAYRQLLAQNQNDVALFGIVFGDFAHRGIDAEDLLQQQNAGTRSRRRNRQIGLERAAISGRDVDPLSRRCMSCHCIVPSPNACADVGHCHFIVLS